ncbi:carbon storage regulator [Pseudomonas sp. M47T1]|uniref:carbon storage regulator n=1 Tax=Pseudomonas sp. M47T1 TaxID=1179778 RepID=UPI0002607E05|nr:carbon storage regulator [Pseudomonas sp. M47T1]EIK94042.1 carbon storage regulator [Pseudomonas sp. M47T1]
MLILTRRVGEKIIIDGKIVVVVQQVINSQVRIGIQAPESVEILREEVFQRNQSEVNHAAN